MFTIGKIYKWHGWSDVAFQVTDIRGEKLQVLWYNIGKCHKMWCMGLTQSIRIPEDRRKEYIEHVE